MTPFVDFGQVLCWPDVNRLRRVIVRLFGWGFRADRPPNAGPHLRCWRVCEAAQLTARDEHYKKTPDLRPRQRRQVQAMLGRAARDLSGTISIYT